MLRNPMNDEVPQLARLRDRWLQLPLSYRLNALLYFLGASALLFLVWSVVLGGGNDSRKVQVGAGVPRTSTSAVRLAPSTAAPAGSLLLPTSSTTAGGPTTTGGPGSSLAAPSAAAAPAPAAGPAVGPAAPAAGSPSQVASPPPPANSGGTNDATPPATSPPSSVTTTTAVPCNNSTDARCGVFIWDPPPAANQPLTVTLTVRPGNPKVGDMVTFDVTVDDPDHLVSGNCSEVRFGDGGTANAPCTPPPDCPPHYGPWTPPDRKPGHLTTTYNHVYQGAGIFPARFTFRSWGDTCLGLDPYANTGEREVLIAVAPS